MRTQRGCKKIRLVFHRSFRRPVKIRIETEPPRSADWIAPHMPVGVLLLATRRSGPAPRPQLRVIHLELRPPDWRIVGDHDLNLEAESEGSKV
jgi:hypothetical protein